MCPDAAVAQRRNYGLRLALVVTAGILVEIVRGALLPPLAALIALQLLALPGPRPPVRMVAGLLAVMSAAAAAAYLVAAFAGERAVPHAVGVGLIYLWGFWLALRPATAMVGTMLLTMGIAVTAMAALSTGFAAMVVVELVLSVVVGIALVYLAHALFPHRGGGRDRAAPGMTVGVRSVLWPAVAATLVILPLHLALTADGLAALVVLFTVATMLRQPSLAETAGYARRFALGNVVGGTLASICLVLVALQPHWPVLVASLAAGSLVMAWQMARRPERAPALLPGLSAFALLFGLGFVPVVQPMDVALVQRLVQIALAALYALCAISLLEPLFRRAWRPGRGTAPTTAEVPGPA